MGLVIVFIMICVICFAIYLFMKSGTGKGIVINDKYAEKRLNDLRGKLSNLNGLTLFIHGSSILLRHHDLLNSIRNAIRFQLLSWDEFKTFETKIEQFIGNQKEISKANLSAEDKEELVKALAWKVDSYFEEKLNFYKELAVANRTSGEKDNIKNRIENL